MWTFFFKKKIISVDWLHPMLGTAACTDWAGWQGGWKGRRGAGGGRMAASQQWTHTQCTQQLEGERKRELSNSYIGVRTHGQTAKAFLSCGRAGLATSLGLLHALPLPHLHCVVAASLRALRPLAPLPHLTVNSYKQQVGDRLLRQTATTMCLHPNLQ